MITVSGDVTLVASLHTITTRAQNNHQKKETGVLEAPNQARDRTRAGRKPWANLSGWSEQAVESTKQGTLEGTPGCGTKY
jgi:hypothetical protein